MSHRALAEAIELFELGLSSCHGPEDRVMVERYLAALAPLLAAVVLGKDVLGRLRDIERLFGNTRLIVQEPFEVAFSQWRDFREEYEHFAVRGMTVNERLSAFLLLEDYDRAVALRDVNAIKSILATMHVDEDSIATIVGKIFGTA